MADLLNGLSSKMFQVFSVRLQTTRRTVSVRWDCVENGDPFLNRTILKQSLAPWMNSGMVWRGVCLTRNSSESPNVAEECSLSDVLESHVPQRFFLSPKAAAGILRRAEKRGRMLPMPLQRALEGLARIQADSEMGGTQLTQSSMLSVPVRDITVTAAQGEMEATTSLFSKPSVQSGQKEAQDQPEMSTTISQSAFKMPEASEIIGKTESESKKAARCTPSTEQASMRLAATLSTEEMMNTMAELTMSVRRLTPTECEILQGFPKAWTVPGIEL
jgi:hypothetical protein